MTLYELGKEYLSQADNLHTLILNYSAQAKTLSGIRLYEINSQIVTLREMERETRIIGKQLTEYYEKSNSAKSYHKHQYN